MSGGPAGAATVGPGHAEGVPLPSVSVLIPTRDRPDDLRRCLATVLACDYPDFEVIVVDQSCGEASAPCADDAHLRYCRGHGTGKSRALNEALALAGGEIVAFTDDDCTVPPGWLRRAVDVLEREPGVGLFFGPLDKAPHDWRTMLIPAFAPTMFQRLSGPTAYRQSAERAPGANMVGRRHVLASIGGFDEQLGPGAVFPGEEEFDLLYRVLRSGYDVILDPSNPVVHWGARPYADGSAQRLMRGYQLGEGAVFAKHLRCGDASAVYDVSLITIRALARGLGSLITSGRPTGVVSLLCFWCGLAAGLRHPLDRRRRLFRVRDA